MVDRAKILVIDDDRDFRESVRSLLEGHGYTVTAAHSGRDGLLTMVQDRPDAIVLDVMMESDVEGYGVNAAIKHQEKYRAFRDIPILMVSAIELSPDERFPPFTEAAMLRPDHYFTKPLDIPRFLEVLKGVLA